VRARGHSTTTFDDPEADAFIVQPRGDVQIGARGLQKSAGMVVDQHFAALRDPGKREHGVDRPARHDARVGERAVGIGPHHE
jgi:hypothetical protein